jgi:hypothetical protein
MKIETGMAESQRGGEERDGISGGNRVLPVPTAMFW